jgi:DNA-directed RNA polymerase specialized sigma24 family protein
MGDRIEDRVVKEALGRYRDGDDGRFHEVVEMISHYIYNYPRIVFGADRDVCGGFYEYVLARMKEILGGYRVTGAKFLTWLTVVLRNRYLNYLREAKGSGGIEAKVRVVSLDGEYGSRARGGAPGDTRSLYDVVGDRRYLWTERCGGYDELLEGIVRNIRESQRVYFHLYFIDTIRPEDMAFLAIQLDRPVSRILEGVRSVRGSMEEKYRLKWRLEHRLNALFYDLLHGQRDGKGDLVGRLKNRQAKLVKDYERVKLNPSYESIAKFLGLPVGTVSTGIMRMKKSVQSRLEETGYEKMQVQ